MPPDAAGDPTVATAQAIQILTVTVPATSLLISVLLIVAAIMVCIGLFFFINFNE